MGLRKGECKRDLNLLRHLFCKNLLYCVCHECLYLHFPFRSPVQTSEQQLYFKTLSAHMPILALIFLADLVHYSHSAYCFTS